MKCPCCGYETIPTSTDVEVDYETRTVARNGLTARLTKKQLALFTLVDKRPHCMSQRDLVERIYAEDPNGGPLENVIGVMAGQANDRLAPLGLTITSKGGKSNYHVARSDP